MEISKTILESFFNDQLQYFLETLKKRIYDVNVAKSSNINPHKREVQIANIHRLLFSSAFEARTQTQERVENDSNKSMVYQLSSVERMYDVLGEVNLLKVTKTGDITIAAPWGILKEDFDISNNNSTCSDFTVEKNSIVLLISIDDDNIQAFLPCGGPDPETDTVLPWVEEVKVSDLCHVHEESLPVIPGNGLSNNVDAGDINFLGLKGQFQEGDTVIFKKEKVHVYAFGVYFMDDRLNSVRIKEEFKFSHKPQPFKIQRMPTIQGKLVLIPKSKISIYRPCDIKLKNINKFGVGLSIVSYHNFCFNSVGFMTHDTAVME